MSGRSSDWGGLGVIIDEADAIAAREAASPPTACPNHGDPLDRGPDGVLNCPLGDYTFGWSPKSRSVTRLPIRPLHPAGVTSWQLVP